MRLGGWKRIFPWAVLSVLAGVLLLAGLVFLPGFPDSRGPGEAGPEAGGGGSRGVEAGSREQGMVFGRVEGVWGAMGKDSIWLETRKEGGGEADQGLGDLPYLAGYQAPPSRSGVLVYDEQRARKGVNLCLSAHKASAVLMDMEGKVLHEWAHDHEDIPEALRERESRSVTLASFWRSAHAFENGDLLAIHDYRGLIKVDRFSRMLWYVPNGAHHDLTVMPDGRIFVLSHQTRVVSEWNETLPITEDFIAILDPDGREMERVSIPRCFENSRFSDILKARAVAGGDLFHANKIQVLDGALEAENPAFRKGNILVSLRETSSLAVVDMEKRSVAWTLTGGWREQHESQLLENGRLILLDNLGFNGFSRILEIEPSTGRELWEYHGDPPESFRTFLAGDLQRLDNGNTLITDTRAGRAFEVTSGSQVVWEYVNPHQVPKSRLAADHGVMQDGGPDRWLIAALLQMTRLPADFPLGWIPGPGEKP